MSSGFTFGAASTPKTTGMGFGATTATPTFGSPAPNAPNTGLTFGSLAQSGLASVTPQQQASGITFGTPNTQPGLTFGQQVAPPATTQTGLSFGTPTAGAAAAAVAAAPQAGFAFGGAPTSTPLFGSNATFGQTGLNFGAAGTSAPQTLQQSGGFSFGAPASSAFGTPVSSATFGTPTPAAATTATAGFGTPAPTATPAAAFGASPAPTFGTPAAATTFGLPTTSTAFNTPSTSAAFGAPAATAFSAPATTATFGGLGAGSVGFPTPQTSTAFGAPTTSTGFGTPTTSAPFPVATSFGAPTAATTASTLGLTLGATPITSSFGAATTAPSGLTTTSSTVPPSGFGLSFGTPNTTAPASGLSFNLGSNAAATTAKPSGFFASSTPVSGSLNFGSVPSTTQSGFGLGTGSGTFSLNLGSLGSTTATTTTTTVTTTTPSLGLGGLDASQNKLGLAGSGSSRNDSKAVKDNQAENCIVETVDNFKKFLKQQKNLSSDVARGSVKPLNKVQEETANLKQTLASLQNGIQRSSGLVIKLKADTAKCLQNAEMAQRTHEAPPGLQYDNTAPLKFFQDLVANFEHEMKVFKLEINNTEKHLHSLMQPMPLTSQELSLAMRRLHDSFVALAGRLQSVHNSVETEKNQYLLLRKYFLKDSTNVFEEEAKKSILANSKTKSCSKASAGPTPFSALGGQHGFGLLSSSSTLSKPSLSSGWSGGQASQQLQQTPQPLQQAQSQLQQSGFSAPTLSNTLFGVPNSSSFTSPQPVENQNFQLQKPPLGNKRGKR